MAVTATCILLMWLRTTSQPGVWSYGVHRTCAEMGAVPRGTSHVTTKQQCKYTTSVDVANALCKPSKHAGSDCVLPETGPDDCCTPACFLPDQRSLGKPWPGHPHQIRVGFAQYDPRLLWKNGTETDAGSRVRHIPSGPSLAARWP